jgi:uncharacterized SAM-binding protein YcdF (DUF218 family)
MVYLAKKSLEALLSPLALSLLIAAVALICWRLKRLRLARTLFIAAAAIIYVGSFPIVGDALLGPLEHRYPPLRQDEPPPAADYVVVLGAGYLPHDDVPVTAALNEDGLARVVEAVRIALRLNGARLVVSGGAPAGQIPTAIGYAELARGLGISQGSLVLLDTPLDTRAEARAVAALVGRAPFILVTSAYHMPRAMLELQRAGVQPIPAPTGQLVLGSHIGDLGAWLPNSGALRKVERALHEYVGLMLLTARAG